MNATLDLDIGGMTCASCASRIERQLNRVPGFEASVNLATDTATVHLPPDADPEVGLARAVATVERLGYTATVVPPDPEPEPDDVPQRVTAYARRAVVAGVLALPVLVLSMIGPLQFEGWGWVALAFSVPVVTWAAWPFHRAALVNARHGSSTMDTLISLGVSAATLWSVYALVAGGRHLYFEVASVVTVFLLTGRWAELRARHGAAGSLRALLRLGATEAVVLREGVAGQRREVVVPAGRLQVGEEFLVRPGALVATDGLVVSGGAAVDMSLVTGEAMPVDVGPGDPVVGGTTVAGGQLVVRATRVGADTTLSRMRRTITAAQSGKAQVQRLADRVSAVFVPTVIGLALATAVVWLLVTGDADAALTSSVAVLVIACPCALGLATPTALLVGSGRGAQLGVLIRSPEVLEATRRLDTIVLDKTGTLTTGRMSLLAVHVADRAADVDPAAADRALALAAAVESGSEHPIAAAVVAGASERGLDVFASHLVERFSASGGRGVRAVVDGLPVVVGRASWVLAETVLPDDAPRLGRSIAEEEARGRTVLLVAWQQEVRAVLAVADTVRPSSAAAVAGLRALGLRPMLVTGDNPTAARALAEAVGIDATDVIAGVLPEDKAAEVARLRAAGHVVAMLGDGVNDAPALAAADLGMAMGSGADVAMEVADVTLVRADPELAVTAVRLSRATLRIIHENLFWAFAYNIAGIPLAAAGMLSPMIAGLAMAASSVLVVGNSLRLARFERRPNVTV